jgi:hypothetical protein
MVVAEIRGDDGALAIGATAEAAVAGGGEVRGHQQIMGNSAALTERGLGLARSAQRRNDQQNWPRINPVRLPYARA